MVHVQIYLMINFNHCTALSPMFIRVYFGQVKSIEYFSFIHVPLPRDYLKLWPETLKTASYFCQKYNSESVLEMVLRPLHMPPQASLNLPYWKIRRKSD